MDTMTYTASLKITTCYCGIKHAVPENLYNNARRAHDNKEPYDGIYCPLGHRWFFADEREVDRLRRLASERGATIVLKNEEIRRQREIADRAKRSAAAQKGQRTKLMKRIKNGVCPCCNRHFKNLAAHMQNQHPEYTHEPEQEETDGQ